MSYYPAQGSKLGLSAPHFSAAAPASSVYPAFTDTFPIDTVASSQEVFDSLVTMATSGFDAGSIYSAFSSFGLPVSTAEASAFTTMAQPWPVLSGPVISASGSLSMAVSQPGIPPFEAAIDITERPTEVPRIDDMASLRRRLSTTSMPESDGAFFAYSPGVSCQSRPGTPAVVSSESAYSQQIAASTLDAIRKHSMWITGNVPVKFDHGLPSPAPSRAGTPTAETDDYFGPGAIYDDSALMHMLTEKPTHSRLDSVASGRVEMPMSEVVARPTTPVDPKFQDSTYVANFSSNAATGNTDFFNAYPYCATPGTMQRQTAETPTTPSRYRAMTRDPGVFYVCPYCTQEFNGEHSDFFAMHMANQGKKTFICPIAGCPGFAQETCQKLDGQSFKNKPSQGTQPSDRGDRPGGLFYACTACSREFIDDEVAYVTRNFAGITGKPVSCPTAGCQGTVQSVYKNSDGGPAAGERILRRKKSRKHMTNQYYCSSPSEFYRHLARCMGIRGPFECPRPNCRKVAGRIDLLQRHSSHTVHNSAGLEDQNIKKQNTQRKEVMQMLLQQWIDSGYAMPVADVKAQIETAMFSLIAYPDGRPYSGGANPHPALPNNSTLKR